MIRRGLLAASVAAIGALSCSGDTIPLSVTLCCESWPGGKCYSVPIGDCPPSHDLVQCCGPASEPDGSVSCGC